MALADELTPSKSLARTDAATTRVITNVTVVGTILTGLGLLTAALPTLTGTARALAMAAVVAAVAAVACALAAQTLTIRTNLNTRNIPILKSWYRQQFRRRAYPTRAATILLICSLLLAGAAAITALAQPPQNRPVIAITQTQTAVGKTATEPPKTAVAVEVTFRALAPSETLTVTVSAGSTTVAKAVISPQSDGSASHTMTILDIPLIHPSPPRHPLANMSAPPQWHPVTTTNHQSPVNRRQTIHMAAPPGLLLLSSGDVRTVG
jgi:hypothetical protein